MKKDTLDILYDGYKTYCREQKGYLNTATKAEIESWEDYKLMVHDFLATTVIKIRKASGRTEARTTQ